MAIRKHIRNPLEWTAEHVAGVHMPFERPASSQVSGETPIFASAPEIRRIRTDDLVQALSKGWDDLGAYRTDVIFICVIYPIAGLILSRLAAGYDMLPLVFPLVSGFALVGPAAAVGLYEISRRREEGRDISWVDAWKVVRSPAFGSILGLGLLLLGIFLLWLGAAYWIYLVTLGPEPPVSIGAFISDVFTTVAGWTMIVLGVGVGFLFAVLVLSISVISFPLLLDRDVGVYAAIDASIRSVVANPGPMAVWGMIVAGGLVLGSIPALLGLIVVMPVLGHATWHLYRKVVAAP